MIGYLTRNHPLIEAFATAPAPRTRRETREAGPLFQAAPRLADLLPAEAANDVRGDLDRPVAGLAGEVGRVAPGSVYFAVGEGGVDGRLFIDEAVRRGAVAIVCSRLPILRASRPTWIEVADVRAALAAAAQRFYRFPDRELTVVGVTGAGNRTAVAHVLKHLLNGDRRVGLINSVHYDLGVRTVPAYRATPPALDLFGMLAQMRDAGCRQAVLELEATAVEQHRLDGLRWEAVVGTVLSEKDVAAQLERLSRPGARRPALTVVNLDDAGGRRLADRLATGKMDARVVTYGEHPAAQVRADQLALRAEGTALRITWPGGRQTVNSPLVGRENVGTLLAAVATAWGLGRDPRICLARVRTFAGVPGRLQRIAVGQGFETVVDAARTGETLRQALGELRRVTPGRLLLVFGCGGEHEAAERVRMTQVAQELADMAVATADNPRAEAIERIFADMGAGVSAPERIAWVADRRRAIALALDLARPGDCVLVAGKGHDTSQELGDTVFPFDDRLVVREILAARRGRGEG